MRNLLCSFAVLALLLGGCETTPGSPPPQARMFSTLKGAAAGIDSYRRDYEAAFARGDITQAQKVSCDRKFNAANEAIIAAAETLRDGIALGLDAPTTPEVDAFVRSFANLVTTLVPPKTR